MYALRSDGNLPKPWIILAKFILLFHVLVGHIYAYPIYPQSKEWVCDAGNVIHNVTLQGGIHAGKFKKVGRTEDMNTCSQFCCEDRKCDVAFMAKQNCYLVSCMTKNLCESVTTESPNLFPRLSYVRKTFFNTHTRTVSNEEFEKSLGKGSYGDIADEGDNPSNALTTGTISKTFKAIDNDESKHLKEKLKLYAESLEKKGTAFDTGQKNSVENGLNIRTNVPTSSATDMSVFSQGCYPAKIHKDVSLRYGTHSGEFYDYGDIGDMRMCVDLCCKDKKCDVAFMVGKTCYTISCSSFDFCQMIPSTKTRGITTQLAYVIKKRGKGGNKKLLISKSNEKLLTHQISTKSHTKSHISPLRMPTPKYSSSERQDVEIGTPKSEIFASDEPNIPKKFTKGCRSNRILSDYGLIGGQRAGVYTLRGITPDFDACIGLCCAEMMCDAAFLLGRRCFSVQCFRNGACAGRPATSHGLRSKLAFVDRKDDDIGEKRASIPGLLPTDRQYTVYLNITNEDFKEGLRDHESLEFLNFAQAVRAAISGILGNVEGFKNIEILQFRPNKVISIFNVTTGQATHPKILLQLIVDSLRKGEVKTFDEPVSGKLTLDVRGFKFLNSKGENLVCPPEHNYDAHWPLAIFGTSVNIPCPRSAKGLSNRRCIGNEDQVAKWDVPDFSDCISQKYEDLFKEAQLLNSASVHSPELTPASIIDRVLQLITTDTYGSNPPAPKGNAKTFYTSHGRFRAGNVAQEPVSRGSLHTPEIENLRKLVAERRRKEQMLEQNKKTPMQKPKPAINLLSFFRGPTAKLIKADDIKINPHKDDVKIASVSFAPNPKPIFTPKLPIMDSVRKVPVQDLGSSQQPINFAGHPRQSPVPNVLAHEKPLPQPRPPLIQPAARMFSQQALQPQPPQGPQQNEQAQRIQQTKKPPQRQQMGQSLQVPETQLPQRPQQPQQTQQPQQPQQPQQLLQQRNQGPFQNSQSSPYQRLFQHDQLRNIDRGYNQDLRKFNGNPKVDPTLLLSQGYWSKPQKFHAQTRSVPVQGLEYPGKVYHTLSLPEDNFGARPETKWTFTRNSPTKKLQVAAEPAPTDRRSFLPPSGQTAQQQANRQAPELNLSFARSYRQQPVNRDQLFIGPETATSQLNHKLNERRQNLAPVNPVTYKQGQMQQPYGMEDANRKNYIVSIRKRRSTKDVEETILNSFNDDSNGLDDKAVGVVTKRDAFGDSRKTDDEVDQDSVLESLTNDESDGDGLEDIEKANREKAKNAVRITGTAVAKEKVEGDSSSGNIEGPIGKQSKDELSNNANTMADKRQPFRLIEKASYRPNDPDISVKPVVVNLPLVNDGSVVEAARTAPAHQTQQGTLLDMDYNRMNLPDPRETSSYTEAHVDNPNINAVASAKIYHGDNVMSDGKTSSNVEITGIEGSPEKGPSPQQEEQAIPTGESAIQNPVETPPSQEQNIPNAGNEGSLPMENASTNPPEAAGSDLKGLENEQKNEEQSQNIVQTEKKPEEIPPSNEEEIPTIPLENRNDTADDAQMNKLKDENEEIPQVHLKKLTVNETEENAYKLAGKNQESDNIFTFEKEHGENRAAMLGGDILLSADIFEELSNFIQTQTDAPSPQEIKEFIEAASSLLDEKNAREWKNAQRHLKVIANEGEINPGDIDVQDWASLRKLQSKRKPNVLLELVDDIEEYGKAASRLITKYNPVFQKPVITPNIIMQFKVLLVEDLDERQSDDNRIVFPNYTNPSIAKWSNARDQISLPAYQLAENIQPTSMVHVTMFMFKTVHKLQRLQDDMDENDDQEVLDENPMKVGSGLISMSVDPPLPNHLRAPVTINLQNTNFDPKAQHECAFWNTTTNDWSTEGCNVVSFNETHTKCECDHLTTFGVLVDTSKPQGALPPKESKGQKEPVPPPESQTTDNKPDKPAEKPLKPPPAVPAPAPPPPPPAPPPPKASPAPQPSKTTPKQTEQKSGGKNNILLWILIVLIILIILLLLCLCCLFCWLRRRNKEDPKKQKEIVSSSGSGTSVGSEMLVDKSRLAPKKSQGRSESPSPRDSPGWLKLKSNAEHQDEILMREKALLFSDYHQPYNFLAHVKERPNTSLESVYGGSDVALPKSSSSSSSQFDSLVAARRMRSDSAISTADDSVRPKAPVHGGKKRNSYPPINTKSEESPKRNGQKRPSDKRQVPTKNDGGVMPKNLRETGSTSMEWDPYYLNTKKKEEEKRKLDRKQSNAHKKSRNISPISEENTEDREDDQPIDSVAPQVGSDEAESEAVPDSESLYPLNSSDTSESAAQAAAAPQQRFPQPHKTTPPQRTSPPQRSSPPERSMPPKRSSPPQRSAPPSKNTSPPQRDFQRISPRSSGEPSPRTSESSEKSDKRTQYNSARR